MDNFMCPNITTRGGDLVCVGANEPEEIVHHVNDRKSAKKK
jgi:hypothetical protein